MQILHDFHLHTSFSEDSDTPMEHMIQKAVSLGLSSICFTEHMDHDYPSQYGGFEVDTDAYYSKYLEMKEKYRDQIELLFGLELGMQNGLGTFYSELAGRYPLDFLIVSQHLVKRLDPYYPEYWEDRDDFTSICDYYKEVLENLLEMKEYDTLGHLDYIVRYSKQKEHYYSYADYADLIDPILKHLIHEGKCLEVNSAGLKYGLGHTNPGEEVLLRYRELGGSLITIGSDGHRPEHMAYDFELVAPMLKKLGFSSYTIFRQRKPFSVEL